MKKIVAVFLLIVALISIMLPISVFAEEEAPNTVIIDCNAIGSDGYGKTLRVYFKNIETEEIIDRKITTIGNNKFTDIPAGEYTYVKCTLDRNENVMFELAREVENLVVYDDQPSVFMFKIAQTATETQEGAMDAYEQGIKNDLIYISLSMAIITLLVCWIIFAIIGRRHNRMKWVARFVLHLLISTVFFMIAIAVTKADSDLAFVWAIAAGFPYGFALTTRLFRGPTGVVSVAAANSAFSAQMLIATFVGVLVGVIAFPIVFIIDIVRIIKNPPCF